MADHHASVRWTRGAQPFTDARYSRAHVWSFDGGLTVPASASPAHVPLPLSDASAVDPEEAFVAALSSCHMLVFLHLAAKRGLRIDEYVDSPVGTVTLAAGRLTLTRVVLRPVVHLGVGTTVTEAELARLHHDAHEECFLAGAVRAEMVILPSQTSATRPRSLSGGR
jgi:organic hydroperoxide reductase OsmC/OhrA